MGVIEILKILNNGWMIHGLKKLESMEENGSNECPKKINMWESYTSYTTLACNC